MVRAYRILEGTRMNRKSEYKDKKKYRETNARYKKKYYKRTENARNKGKLWTKEEDEKVLAHDIPDRELAELIGRSQKAIIVRRSRLIRWYGLKE